MTGIKDAYEDIKRHQSDRRVNNSEIQVLAEGPEYANHNAMAPKSRTFVRALTKRIRRRRITKARNQGAQALGDPVPPETLEKSAPAPSDVPDDEEDDDDLLGESPGAGNQPHWKGTTWEDLRIGDFVKIMDHESIPADILICATSEDDNVAFVETKNLDGETNLKSRNAVPALAHLRNAKACASAKNTFQIECDRPEVLMHKLTATVVINDERQPVDLQTTLLRGTVLRNTRWVIGIVMYTGLDTKLVLNSGGTPSKRSKVERQMNPMVSANLLILTIMGVVCGIADSVLEHHYYPRQAPWLFGANRSDDNPSINGLITLIFAFITFVPPSHFPSAIEFRIDPHPDVVRFQNIVPISLYISVEVVRSCQAAFIYFDSEIYYKKTDQPALARNFTLSDDLGQIEYIFSDKTGTLTQVGFGAGSSYVVVLD
jgi:phospholipid-translocating ATPase